MKNVIQITDKILGVIVPESAFDFNLCNSNIIDYWKDFEGGRSGEIELPEGTTSKDWKIHGTCTLPLFELDFIYGTGSYDTMVSKKRIKKAINDLGLYAVNPVKLMDGKNISCGEEAEAYNENIMAFEEAESKTVKKLLLIEKI
jgi:hypothetical protein